MKRVVTLCVCFTLLLSAFAFSAFAANVYQFDDVGTMQYYRCSGTLPEGEYYFSGTCHYPLDDGEVYTFTSDPFTVHWDSGSFMWEDAVAFSLIDNRFTRFYTSAPVDFAVSPVLELCDDSTYCHFAPEDALFSVVTLTLIPVSADSAPVLSDVVTGDMISGVLDPLVTLIPVVFGGLACFLGIRKGIGFVEALLNGG